MAADEDLTLTNILELSKKVVRNMEDYFKNAVTRISELDGLIADIDVLIQQEKILSNKTSLLQYKSSLLQIKSDIENEIESMKKEQVNTKIVVDAVSKAIKWNSGDIF